MRLAFSNDAPILGAAPPPRRLTAAPTCSHYSHAPSTNGRGERTPCTYCPTRTAFASDDFLTRPAGRAPRRFGWVPLVAGPTAGEDLRCTPGGMAVEGGGEKASRPPQLVGGRPLHPQGRGGGPIHLYERCWGLYRALRLVNVTGPAISSRHPTPPRHPHSQSAKLRRFPLWLTPSFSTAPVCVAATALPPARCRTQPRTMALCASHVIVVGDPGVGKSTFLNSLVGAATFQSGLSVSCGLTKELQSVVINGTRFSDTPGLDDNRLKEQAAAAIVQAVYLGGNVKIVFIMTMEGGRLRGSNLATIKIVLGALQQAGIVVEKSFSVVFNKVTKGELQLWQVAMSASDAEDELADQIGLANAKPERIRFLPEEPVLKDSANGVHPQREVLVGFLNKMKAIPVPPGTSINVDASKVGSVQKEMETELTAYRSRWRRAGRSALNVGRTTAIIGGTVGAGLGIGGLGALLL